MYTASKGVRSMEYIITGLVAIITGVLVFILQMVIRENRDLKREKDKAESDRVTALENGVVCILRKHLMDEHEIWTKKGYITAQALESGLLMYKAYKGLGGNGMIDHMEEEVKNLPIHD